MTKKLEELFNLEKSEETAETLKDKLETEQNDKDDAQANALIQEKIGLDKIDAALPQVDGLEDDKEIDFKSISSELNCSR